MAEESIQAAAGGGNGTAMDSCTGIEAGATFPSTRPARPRVVLLGRQRLAIEAIASSLRADSEIQAVSVHHQVSEALKQIRCEQPDVVVIDYTDEAGLLRCLIEGIHQVNPYSRVIVLTQSDRHDLLPAVILAGAAGRLTKDQPLSELAATIKQVHCGQVSYSAMELATLISREGVSEARKLAAVARLGPREIEVLQCIADGLTVGATSEKLGISVHTVRTHIKRILTKLDAHSRVEAVMTGLRSGLIHD
jgi:DNA-binding NarL/FixJ family response regulator